MINMVTTPFGPWGLLSDLVSLQDEFNRLLDDGSVAYRYGRHRFPPVNVWQSADRVIVDAEIPGVEPDAVQIDVANGEVTISGKRPALDAESDAVYQRERPAGEFSRSVRLPYRVDADQVTATYRNGVLRVTLPRTEADRPRRIQVKAA